MISRFLQGLVGLNLVVGLALSQPQLYSSYRERKFMQDEAIIYDADHIENLAQFKCQYLDGNYVVNLQELSINDNGEGYKFQHLSDGSLSQEQYLVSFCDTLPSSPCGQQTMAIQTDDQGQCQAALSGKSAQNDQKIEFNVPTGKEDDSDYFAGSVLVTYSGGEACPSGGNYGLEIEIFCVPDEMFANPVIRSSSDPCVPRLRFDSEVGCGIEISYLWEWVTENEWVMFGLALAVGLFLCFLGLKLYNPIFFLAGTLATIFLILLIFYSSFLKSTTEEWVVWTVLGCAFLIGLLVGYIVMKISILGAAVLGFGGGYALGLLIWNTFLYLTTTSEILFYTFTIGLGVIVGLLALILFDHVVILGSAMLGAFIAIAGVGVVAGGYSNPFTTAKVLVDGQTIESTFYYYLAATVVLFIIGAIVQYYHRKKANEYKHPYHTLK